MGQFRIVECMQSKLCSPVTSITGGLGRGSLRHNLSCSWWSGVRVLQTVYLAADHGSNQTFP